MKKGIIIATALVGIAGGVAFGQTALFGSAQNEEFLTAAAAKKIALQQFNGTVTDYDFDRDDRTPHYEFEIKNDTEEVDVEVNAINGTAKITERKSLKNDDKFEDSFDQAEAEAEIVRDTARQETANATEKTVSNTQTVTTNTANANATQEQPKLVPQTTEAIITKSQAIAIAQAKAAGTVTKAKLDEDDGIQVYEIEIKNGNTEYDFEIHASTGQILEFDTDYDDDNDDDNDDRYDD